MGPDTKPMNDRSVSAIYRTLSLAKVSAIDQSQEGGANTRAPNLIKFERLAV